MPVKLDLLGVTEQKKKQFFAKGIYSVEDLLRFLPRKYMDFTRETGILSPDKISCVTLKVDRLNAHHNKTPLLIAHCVHEPTNSKVLVKWFHQTYLLSRYSKYIGKHVYACGKLVFNEEFNAYEMVSPMLFELSSGHNVRRILPIYSKIPGMSAEYFNDRLKTAFSHSEYIKETCPPRIVSRERQMPIDAALKELHFPTTSENIKKAQDRLIFDDMLAFALRSEWASRNSAIGSPFPVKTTKAIKKILTSLPFDLTGDQRNAVNSMIQHTREGKRINALVQGDVGCGKTIIAFLLMICFADSGYQAVFMAPTQVLAYQHYLDLCKLAEPCGFKVVYLGGSGMKKKEKNLVLSQIKSGEAQLIVGTHSVIGKSVIYHNLALTIADEEHKFGVAQRAALVEKAAAGVHSVTMSATPIPRTLAQVLYGSALQLYTIRTMPSGRKPVITGISTTREKIYRFIVKEAKAGHQTYVVCPMIEHSDEIDDMLSVADISEQYSAALSPHGIRIRTLTSKDSKDDTDRVIKEFKNGDIDVLIATTVIEVGVNVPSATLMVIVNAERYGLSTLHQLRGRVGRSDLQAYCVLDSQKQTEEGQKRLEVLCQTTDGFKIAEADLAIRGAGDFLGTRQSGDNKSMALMLAYPDRYVVAQRIAAELLDSGESCPILDDFVADTEDFAI